MPQHGREATDGTIVAQVLAGDRDAFAHLVVRYQSVVHSIALAQLHHFADAEDVVQETFVRAFQSLDKLHVPGKFGAWIVTIARNTANTVGKQRQRAAMQPLSEADEPVAETDPGRQELRDLVAAELAKLPEDQREVLTLHYFSGKTTAEIAALLAISRHAAKKRLERSRALLGEKLLLRVGENVAEDKLTTAKRVQRAMAAVAGVTASWESAEAAAAVTGAAGITAATASGAGFVVKAAIAAVVAAVVVVGGGLYTGHVPLPKWDRAGTDITRSDTVASSGDAAPAQDTRDKNGIDNAGAAPIAPTPGSTGTATGTVIDVDTNKPIPKVQLAWWRMPMEGRSPRRQGDVVFASLQAARPQRTELAMSIAPSMVTTDNQGRFTINGPPGTYSIRVHDPVWVDDDRGVTFEVHESHTTEGIIVPALVGGVVSGRVFDVETGIGVPGVAIHLRHSGIVLEGSGETITDSAGRYRFQGLREGNGDLTRDDVPPYSRPDRQDRKDVSIGPRETMANLDFPLERGVTVAGRVVDGAGNALPDVALKTWAGMEELKTLSAAGGAFEFERIPPRTALYINAEREGYVQQPMDEVAVGRGGDTDVTVTMQPAARMTGRVVDANGTPMAGARLGCDVTNSNGRSDQSVVTGVNGEFEVTSLIGGEYTLYVTPAEPQKTEPTDSVIASPYLEHSKHLVGTMTIDYGQRLDNVMLVYDLDSGLAISGYVTDTQGNPLPDVNVMAGGQQVHNATKTDAEGWYQVTGLLEGEYWITVSGDGVYAEEPGFHAGDTEANIAVEIQRGTPEEFTVIGHVTDAETGQPLTSFEYLEDSWYRDSYSNNMLGDVRQINDGEGVFRLTTGHAADYTFIVRAPGHAPQLKNLTLGPGSPQEINLNFSLEPAARVQGKVVDPAGQPLAGAMILPARVVTGDNIEGSTGQPIYPKGTDPLDVQGAPHVDKRSAFDISAADGSFTVDTLLPETQLLSAFHSDYLPGSVSVTPKPGETQRVTIQMAAMASVRGTIRYAGQPVKDGSVTINYVDESQNEKHAYAQSIMEPGAFDIGHLVAGEVLVIVQTEDEFEQRRKITQTVALRPGVTIDLAFEFAPGNAAAWGSVTVDGASPTRVRPNLIYERAGETEEISGTSSEDGTYQLNAVLPGPATLTISARPRAPEGVRPAYAEESVSITLPAGGRLRRDFMLTSPGT